VKTYEIICGRECHLLGVDNDGKLHLLNHNIDEEETLRMMGEAPCACYKFYLDAQTNLDSHFLSVNSKGHTSLIRCCLDLGADIHACNDEALRLACETGSPKLVRILVEQGANIHAIHNSTAIVRTKEGEEFAVGTPLTLAIKRNHSEIMHILVDAGALKPNEALRNHLRDLQASDRA